MNQLRDMGEAMWYSFTQALGAFMSFLPALLGALVILIVGWFIAKGVARLAERGLRGVGLERAVDRSGIGHFIEQSGTRWTVSGIIGALIKWSIFLIFIQAAASAIGMEQITAIINSIILFIPKLIVALAIVVIGALIARFLGGLVRGSLSEMGVGNPGLFAKLAQYAIIGFALVAAFNELGIAETVVNTLLIGLIGALALALGLAFGLGGRETAARITQNWYEKGNSMADRFRQRSDRYQPGDVSPAGFPPRRFDPGRPGPLEPRMGD
ncbi:MAG: small-conductance mechanosensitive ion channel [Blastocatellales bacterium]